MENKILLSFAIIIYNRAFCVASLLNNVLPQARKLKGEVEICISDNGPTDNTRETVIGFQKKYLGLIKYSANEKNLGVNANIIKAVAEYHDVPEGNWGRLWGRPGIFIK